MNAWYEIHGDPNNRNRFEAIVSVNGENYRGIHVDATNAFEQALCMMPEEVLDEYLSWHLRNRARYVGLGNHILEIDGFDIFGYIGAISLSIWMECPQISSRPLRVQNGRWLKNIGDETAQRKELEDICEKYLKQRILEKRKYL